MRRIIQFIGVEVIHLWHDRSVEDVVNTAIQEDANAIAMTSYQGGHNEYFKYMRDLLCEKDASPNKICSEGVVFCSEIAELQVKFIRLFIGSHKSLCFGANHTCIV